MPRRTALVSVVVMAAAAPGWSVTLHVPAEYPTIQTAMDAAAAGDVVLVAPGTYTDVGVPGSAPAMVALKDGVTLASEAGPDVTTIDFINLPQTSLTLVSTGIRASGIQAARVEGFRLLGRFKGAAGVKFFCPDLVVERCRFEQFEEIWFAGTAITGSGLGGQFELRDSGFLGGYGLAIVDVSNAAVTVSGCSFEGTGPALRVQGSGSATVSGSRFVDNFGTAVVHVWNVPGSVQDCEFTAHADVGGPFLRLTGSSQQVTGCVFSGNASGAVQSQSGAHCDLANNTFVDNILSGSGALGAVVLETGSLVRNVFHGGSGRPHVSALPGLTTACNVFWGNPAGVGVPLSATDREVDPMLCDPVQRDFRLRAGSPCLPEDPSGCGLIGALGHGCGIISIEPATWGRIKAAYRGGR